MVNTNDSADKDSSPSPPIASPSTTARRDVKAAQEAISAQFVKNLQAVAKSGRAIN